MYSTCTQSKFAMTTVYDTKTLFVKSMVYAYYTCIFKFKDLYQWSLYFFWTSIVKIFVWISRLYIHHKNVSLFVLSSVVLNGKGSLLFCGLHIVTTIMLFVCSFLWLFLGLFVSLSTLWFVRFSECSWVCSCYISATSVT